MKFELKQYQDEAVAKVLTGLRKGSRAYDDDREHTAVSLSAPTGAGKTVIAAAVIERTLFGDPDSDTEPNQDTVFVWLTDDPPLNEQTRKKILEASDRIQPGHLVTLNDTFDQAELDPGKVYFLNIQKLGRNSKMVTRKEGKRSTTLWETLNNTIRANGTSYVLIIDEAHRGTRRASREDKMTIVSKLMNGNGLVAAAPVVLGITATPQNFDQAVAGGAQERLPRKVVVPVAAVRESGLIKDVLSISYKGETQNMETTLVRQAVANLRLMNDVWDAYTDKEGEPPVRPALVVQIPPSSSSDDVGTLLDVCLEEWAELGQDGAIAHALESHTAAEFGNHTVRYVAPQNIQDHPKVRLILFKEALTTGWDCPRAEVMVSLRKATDDTYIAQLIGRMVRSPLARRIESDETLNRVRLYLPHFNKAAVEKVRSRLESEDGGLPTDIELNSVDAPRNKALPDAAFDAVETVPSYQVPGPVHRSQVARLHKLAALLINDQLLPNAISIADEHLVNVLEGERARLDADGSLDKRVKDAANVTVAVLNIKAAETTTALEEYATDIADVNRLFAGAKRKFRDGLAEEYWGARVTKHSDDPYDAKTLTIALATDSDVVEKVENEAGARVKQWLDSYGAQIQLLSDDKRAKYAQVRAMAKQPEGVTVSLPTSPITMTGDDAVRTFEKHLYSDASGNCRIKLGSWETHVVEVESARPQFVAWYRNPTGGERCIRIPYETGSGYGKLYPDIVVLHEDQGDIRPSVIDPHGHHLADAGDKLRGLAAYAERHGDKLARVLGVIKDSNGNFRALDLKDATVRSALVGVNTKDAIEQVFSGHGAAYS